MEIAQAIQSQSAINTIAISAFGFHFRSALVYGFTQGFARFEVWNAFGRNGHSLTAAWVAAHARGAVVDRKAAKAAHLDAVTAHQGFAHCVKKGLDGKLGVTVSELAESRSKFFDEV